MRTKDLKHEDEGAVKAHRHQALIDRVEKTFTYHAPKGGQPERYSKLRQHALAFALDIVETTPESREQSLALTKLEEAVMFANAAIARNE